MILEMFDMHDTRLMVDLPDTYLSLQLRDQLPLAID